MRVETKGGYKVECYKIQGQMMHKFDMKWGKELKEGTKTCQCGAVELKFDSPNNLYICFETQKHMITVGIS